MRTRKAALRKNGQSMVTIPVNFHLCLDDLAMLLIAGIDQDSQLPKTYTEVSARIVNRLYYRGTNDGMIEVDSENLTEHALFEQAKNLCQKLFNFPNERG